MAACSPLRRMLLLFDVASCGGGDVVEVYFCLKNEATTKQHRWVDNNGTTTMEQQPQTREWLRKAV